jgi:hypothetical protein
MVVCWGTGRLVCCCVEMKVCNEVKENEEGKREDARCDISIVEVC